jgi:hypothetical protein
LTGTGSGDGSFPGVVRYAENMLSFEEKADHIDLRWIMRKIQAVPPRFAADPVGG